MYDPRPWRGSSKKEWVKIANKKRRQHPHGDVMRIPTPEVEFYEAMGCRAQNKEVGKKEKPVSMFCLGGNPSNGRAVASPPKYSFLRQTPAPRRA